MKNVVKKIMGYDYTLKDVEWCVETGWALEPGRMGRNAMVRGLWEGDEQALREMGEYMKERHFLKLDDAGRVYHAIMRSVERLYSVTDARLVYEACLGLPYRYNDPEWLDELKKKCEGNEKTIRSYVRRVQRRAEGQPHGRLLA